MPERGLEDAKSLSNLARFDCLPDIQTQSKDTSIIIAGSWKFVLALFFAQVPYTSSAIAVNARRRETCEGKRASQKPCAAPLDAGKGVLSLVPKLSGAF